MQSSNNSRELSVLNYIDQHAEATQREETQGRGNPLGRISKKWSTIILPGHVYAETLNG